MFKKRKLNENAHRKEKRAANFIRGGLGLGGIAAIAIKNKDKIIPVVKTVAKAAKTIIFRG